MENGVELPLFAGDLCWKPIALQAYNDVTVML